MTLPYVKWDVKMADSVLALQGLITFAIILVVLLVISVIITAILARKKKKYIGRIITGCLLSIFALSMLIGFWNVNGIVGPAMDADDVAKYEQQGDFPEHNEGDIITLRDEISRLETETFDNNTYVLMWFETSGHDDADFNVIFRDDISGSFKTGDLVFVFLYVEQDNTSREVLRYHAPGREELGARSMQIYPSIYVDIWFWLILIIGAVALVIGILGGIKRDTKEETESEASKQKESDKARKGDLPDEEDLLEESGISTKEELPEEEDVLKEEQDQ